MEHPASLSSTLAVLLDTDCLQDPVLSALVRAKLSPERQRKIDLFRSRQDQRLSLGAGAALDWALHTVGLSEQSVTVALGSRGKPFLADQPGLHFSLSHSGHYAACALSPRPVGVDIEKFRKISEALIRRACTPREQAALSALDGPARQSRFLRLWTAKESYMKLLGDGLALPAATLEVTLEPSPSIRQDGQAREVPLFQSPLPDAWLTVCGSGSVSLTVLTGEALRAFYAS